MILPTDRQKVIYQGEPAEVTDVRRDGTYRLALNRVTYTEWVNVSLEEITIPFSVGALCYWRGIPHQFRVVRVMGNKRDCHIGYSGSEKVYMEVDVSDLTSDPSISPLPNVQLPENPLPFPDDDDDDERLDPITEEFLDAMCEARMENCDPHLSIAIQAWQNEQLIVPQIARKIDESDWPLPDRLNRAHKAFMLQWEGDGYEGRHSPRGLPWQGEPDPDDYVEIEIDFDDDSISAENWCECGIPRVVCQGHHNKPASSPLE